MTKISDKDFNMLWGEALVSSDCDTFVAEWATSIIWGEPEELADDGMIEIADYLPQLWTVAHMTVKEICAAAGLSQRALAVRYCIPTRTVEDWCRGVREPAPYIRLMMAKLLGLLP